MQIGEARWRERIAHPFSLDDRPSRGEAVMSECYGHFKCMDSLDKHSSKLCLAFISGDSPSKDWRLD